MGTYRGNYLDIRGGEHLGQKTPNCTYTLFYKPAFSKLDQNFLRPYGNRVLYVDYNVPFDKIREEQTRILKNTDLWDGKVDVLQVTDTKPNYVEIRCLMSAKDSSTAWDLRVHVREKLIVYLQENYPESIARTTRLTVERKDNTNED